MWETYFCMRFDSRNGRLKPLQSFRYTLYIQDDCRLLAYVASASALTKQRYYL